MNKVKVIIEFEKNKIIQQVLLCLHVNVESIVHVESQLSISAEDEKSVEKNDKHGFLQN